MNPGEFPLRTEVPVGSEMIDGIEVAVTVDHCPWDDITPEVLSLIELWHHYKLGLLLDEGGLMDQDAWYTDAMVYINGVMNKADSDQLERARRDREH